MVSITRFFCVKKERGAALSELAIVAPVLLLVLFGTIQWGFIFTARIALRNAAEVGARKAVLEGGSVTDPSDTHTPQYTYAQVSAQNACNSPLTPSNCVPVQGVFGTGYSMTVSYNLPIFFPLAVPTASGGQLPLTATAVME